MSNSSSANDDDPRFDGLYMNVAQTTHGIEPLLDTVFGFLRRKTDFFAGPPGSIDGTAAAIAKVQEVVQKHADRYKKEQQAKQKQPSSSNSKSSSKTKTSAKTSTPPKVAVEQPFKKNVKEEDDIIEMDSGGDFDISKNQKPASKPVVTSLNPKDETKSASMKPTTEATIPEKDNTNDKGVVNIDPDGDGKKKDGDDDDEDKSPPPVGNGGTVPNKYVWTQTLAEIMVTIPVPDHTRGRDLQVSITKTHLKVVLKNLNATGPSNSKQTLVDGDLTKTIIMDDSFWTVEDGNRLVINLQKQNQMEWWDSVCKGDPTINVRKINPENSSLSDLDGETRKTVEKMMFDQRQKALGLPTSDEQTKLDALENFKRQHPEMDFSNAKIS